MKHYKLAKQLSESTVSLFVTKYGLKKVLYQLVNILLTKIQGLKRQC